MTAVVALGLPWTPVVWEAVTEEEIVDTVVMSGSHPCGMAMRGASFEHPLSPSWRPVELSPT